MVFKSTGLSGNFLKFCIIVALFCLGAFVRISNYNFVFSNFYGHLNFYDPDCYYYLRRLVHFLSHFPHVMRFDPLVDWPVGSRVNWPEGFLLLLGIPLKIFGVHSFRALEIGVCIEMSILGLIVCGLVYALSFRVSKSRDEALYVLFISVISLCFTRYSCFGEVDHHIAEAAFAPLFLLLSYKAFLDVKNWAAIVLAVFVAFSFSVSSSSIFAMGALFLTYFVFFMRRDSFRSFLLFSGSLLILMSMLVLFDISNGTHYLAIDHASFFHLILVGLFVAVVLFGHYSKRIASICIGLVAFCFLLSYFFHWHEGIFRPFDIAMNYVFGRQGVLKNVVEAQPTFMKFGALDLVFPSVNMGYFIWLLPIALPALYFLRKQLDWEERALLFFLLLMSVPSIAQKRFIHLFLGIYFVFLGLLLKHFLIFLRQKKIKIGFGIGLIFVCVMVFPQIRYGFSPGMLPVHKVDFSFARLFTKKVKLDPRRVWDRLAFNEAPTKGIWSNPNLGNLMTYITGYGNLTNTFYHRGSFARDFKLRTDETDAEFESDLKKFKITYFFVVNDFQYFRLLHQNLGKDSSYYLKVGHQDGHEVLQFDMSQLERFAWVRLLSGKEGSSEMRQLFVTKVDAPHFYNFGRLFEFEN